MATNGKSGGWRAAQGESGGRRRTCEASARTHTRYCRFTFIGDSTRLRGLRLLLLTEVRREQEIKKYWKQLRHLFSLAGHDVCRNESDDAADNRLPENTIRLNLDAIATPGASTGERMEQPHAQQQRQLLGDFHTVGVWSSEHHRHVSWRCHPRGKRRLDNLGGTLTSAARPGHRSRVSPAS